MVLGAPLSVHTPAMNWVTASSDETKFQWRLMREARYVEAKIEQVRSIDMAVQQNKKSPSKRGMHRAHDFLTNPPLAVEPTTGEVHLRHHISPSGYYRGKKIVKTKGE